MILRIIGFVIAASATFLAALPAQAAVCGSITGSTIISNLDGGILQHNTTNTQFNDVPGASADITVPAMAARCVKIRFTASVRCRETSELDSCRLRAMANQTVCEPDTPGGIRFLEENNRLSAQAFTWYCVLTAGTYDVRIQARVLNGVTVFTFEDFTLDIETSNAAI